MLDVDLRTLLFPATSESTPTRDSKALFGRAPERRSEAEEAITRTRIAHPLVFALEYALAQQLMQWGIRPQAMLGYSVGEYVAACVAGVLSLEDALHLVARRAQLLEQHAAGVMVAVMLGEQQARAYTSEQVSLAAINTESLCVLAGPEGAIALVEQELHRREIACRRVEATHAFHSGMVEPARDAVTDVVRGMQRHEPQISYLSNVTGTWITGEQATDAEYWGQHMCGTVRFAEGVSHLLREGEWMLIEVGAGQGLSSWVKQHRECTSERGQRVIATMPGRYEKQSELEVLARLMARVWEQGVAIEWEGYYAAERRQRVVLPTYPFERQRYWLAPSKRLERLAVKSSAATPITKKADSADWFYQPVWEQISLASPSSKQSITAPWLIFADSIGLSTQVVERLRQAGQSVIVVERGEQFAQLDAFTFSIRPGTSTDYSALCNALKTKGLLPASVLHCWSVANDEQKLSGSAVFKAVQEQGFYSLLFFIQALNAVLYEEPLQIVAVTNGVQSVTGSETLQPEQSTVLGACKVIPQEFSNIVCRSIDLDISSTNVVTELVDAIVAECTIPTTDLVVAYRMNNRWRQSYKAVRLKSELVARGVAKFRQHGVYLITGGLGGIGLVLSEYLAKNFQARLVLTGRTQIPARETWASWLEDDEPNNSTSLKIQRIQQLEAYGAEVLVLQADASDEDRMRLVIEQVTNTFGTIHGVLHAAGITDEKVFKSVQEIGRAECEIHFQSKVHGTFVLEKLLRTYDLDFCLLFSSLSSVLGGLAFLGYTAGNVFLDAFAHQHNQTAQVPWISINWDTWHVKEDAHGALGGTIAAFAMSPNDAIDAFLRVLGSGYTHLVNSTGDLHARIRQWIRMESLHAEPESELIKPSVSHGLSTLAPMGSEYEQKIREIWQQVLGVEQVGLYDNFFDLGGNSLIALQVISRLKKAFHQPVPAVALFEAPTISALVTYLHPEPETKQEDQRALLNKRRARARSTVNAPDIAIIGMTGRFPGAASVEQFWDNLRNGVESITFFTPDELLKAGIDPALLHDPSYVRARPVLSDEQVQHFDASFFGYSPREAELMDPQHRLFLECAWEVMERAGYDTSTYPGRLGCSQAPI